jgi:hypothetical protein
MKRQTHCDLYVCTVIGAMLSIVEGFYCKGPIQCLASSELLTPPPTPWPPGECVPPRLWCGGRTHSLGGEGGGGVNSSEYARHSSVLYKCKYFVLYILETVFISLA